MFKGLVQNITDTTKEVVAVADPTWNHKFRPVHDDFHNDQLNLPETAAAFLESCERALNVTGAIYGGGLDSLARGKKPKDYDTYLMGRQHPYLTLQQLEKFARREGHEIVPYTPRIRHLWKRTRILTRDGDLFDIGCMMGDIPLEILASDPDVSICARALSLQRAIVTTRCLQGEATDSLIFRPLRNDGRERRKHLRRWLKNAVQKYPNRVVHYQSAEDTERFAELNSYRPQLTEIYSGLAGRGLLPEKTAQWLPYLRNVGISEQQCRLFMK